MERGMMWWDGTHGRSLTEKVKGAASYFQKKYGRTPNLCLVNPAMLKDEKDSQPIAFYGTEIHVRPYRNVQVDCLWLGVDDEPAYVAKHQTSNTEKKQADA
jgi:hypothetical protein